MTSLDPSHIPTGRRHEDHPSRGQAVYRPAGPGKLGLPIPDLRFEQSYLRSLRRFIHSEADHSVGEKGERPEKNVGVSGSRRDNAMGVAGRASGTEAVAPLGLYGLPLRMDWGWILYITARDQILSPFAQGAILAVASLYLRPLLRTLGAHVRVHVMRSWQAIFPPLEPHIQGGAGWMRKQLREFSVGGIGTNIALAK